MVGSGELTVEFGVEGIASELVGSVEGRDWAGRVSWTCSGSDGVEV